MAATLEQWNKAKAAFEATAAKKRPGMDVSKLAKFLKSYKSHTGITPVAKALDDALDAADKNWAKADAAKRAKMAQALRAAYEQLDAKGKQYLQVLAKSIDTELVGGDVHGAVMLGLENMRNTVELMLKGAKAKVVQYETQAKATGEGKSEMEGIRDGMLTSAPATLDKAIAGMRVIVRSVKSKPDLDTWMKQISGDPPTRWATTKLKDLGSHFKKYPKIQDAVGADPMEFQKRLNIYGAGFDESYWKKTFGDEKKHKAEILKHAAEIEKQIGNLEILNTRLKGALKSGGMS